MKTDTQRRLEHRLFWLILADRYRWRGVPSKSPRFPERVRIVEQLHRLSSFQTPLKPQPLASYASDELDVEGFSAATFGYSRPVVIRGFGRFLPGFGAFTPNYLRQQLRGKKCAVVAFDEDSRMRAWDSGVTFTSMAFEEFLERMPHEELYLNNSTELVEACPEILRSLDLHAIHKLLRPVCWDELVTTNFFIGSQRVRSSIHAAFGGNFFLNLAGRKRWRLIGPEHSALLHPVTARPFQYVRSACGGFHRCERQGRGQDNIFVRVPHYEVVLEPGDLLYNAPWWWHEVENLDAFTVGCAVRHFPAPFRKSPSWANHRLFTLASTYPVSRALMFAHYLQQCLTGSRQPFRKLANSWMVSMLYRSFRRE